MTKPILRRAGWAAAALAVASGAALAGEFNPLGDGSDTNNPDLLRLSAEGCENCEPVPPHEWGAPPFDFDWSLGLRGAYVRDKNGDHFEARILPELRLRHDFLRGAYEVSGAAELTRSSVEEFRIEGLRLGLSAGYRFSAALSAEGSANLSSMQPSNSAPGYPTNTLSAGRDIFGDAAGSVTYDFGLFSSTLRGAVVRSVYGPTVLDGGGEIDNSANNNWRAGAGVRLGYEVTPLLTAFVDAGADYQMYDFASPTYGVKLDAADYALRGGLAAKWSDVLEAEGSVGVGLRTFTESGFDDVVSQLYDGAVTFRPDETLTFRGGLATTVGAPGPNSGGSARIEYAATGDVAYQLNPWVTLRAAANLRYATFAGITATETGYGAGTGLDYLVNQNLTVSGDYTYSNTVITPSPAEEEHRVSVGMTFHK